MDKTVNKKLFVCLSKYVVSSSLRELCIDLLEIPYIRLSQIQVKSSDAAEQTLQVIFSLLIIDLFVLCPPLPLTELYSF